ncbi:MAG: hypothetical protein OEM67_09735 [Thermoleophilia bacterium]|nr:hypothetical protein [Thermoleophilia bacterium]MDH3724909.1 hypothetical protein [Thermoleophilia bacterium]
MSRLVPEGAVRRGMAFGMLASVVLAALIFALPFAFPTPPPIITRVKATVLFSPNDDGRRDLARVLLRVREPSNVTLEVRDDDGLVKSLLDGELQPRGSVTADWDGRDEQGRRAQDGTYSLRLRARAGRKQFNISRTVSVDTTAPRFERFSVRSGAFQRRQRARCRVVVQSSDDARVRIEVRRRSATEPIVSVGPRPVKAGGSLDWRWNGTAGGRAQPEGLYRVVARLRDSAGNSVARSATCWLARTSGRTVPRRAVAGDRIGALVHDERGRPLPPDTEVQLALYEREATPGRDAGRPIGRRVAGRASGPMASTTVRLPPGVSPRTLWLVALTPEGRALIPIGTG